MSVSSNNSQAIPTNSQADVAPNRNAAPDLNAATNSPVDPNAILGIQVVLLNRWVVLSLAVHMNIGLGNPFGIAGIY